jgi:toxin YoeB
MSYRLILQPEAERHLKEWRLSGQKKILKKIADLFAELVEHPRTGTGQVEQLRGDLSGFWSRRIDKGSRMIYRIEDDEVIVIIISAQ